MTILGQHRAVIAGLLEGLGLHACPPDRTLADIDVGQVEHAYVVSIAPQRTLDGKRPNTANGSGLFVWAVSVNVGYALTLAGGDEVERAGEQSGSATLEDIEDRIATDVHRIRDAVGKQSPFAGLDPTVMDCRPLDDLDTSTGADRAVVGLRFEIWARASHPGAYGPTL